MSEKRQPAKINKASNVKRFIQLDIDVSKVKKEWFFITEGGAVRLKMTLMMLPDGETDRYGNLGMIVQPVPPDVYKADKKAQGPILGNGQELDWSESSGGGEEVKVDLSNPEHQKIVDDLPF